MFKKRYILSFAILILIYVSFTYPHFVSKKVPMGEKEYSLSTPGMNIHDKGPIFTREDNGKFFVHPTDDVAAKVN